MESVTLAVEHNQLSRSTCPQTSALSAGCGIMGRMAGKQIRIFLTDGHVDGIRTINIANWTGHAVWLARKDVTKFLDRPEASEPAVYLALGASSDGSPSIYLGDGDRIDETITNAGMPADWSELVVITSTEGMLTSANRTYLLLRLRALYDSKHHDTARKSESLAEPPLQEDDRASVDYFLSNLVIVLDILGFGPSHIRATSSALAEVVVFPNHEPNVETRLPRSERTPEFYLSSSTRDVSACARVIDGEFVVLAGSKVVADWNGHATSPSTRGAYAAYRAEHRHLIEQGAIRIEGTRAYLTRDLAFDTPSRAGAIALGRSCNGPTEWRNQLGTYKDWQRATLSSDYDGRH